MKTIHTEIGVAAPADITWEVVSDLRGWARWNPIMRAEGRLALGEEITVTISAPDSKPMVIRPRIVHLEKGKEIRWLGYRLARTLFSDEHGFRVVAEDAGYCRFEHFDVFRGLLANLAYWRNAKVIDIGFQVMNRSLKREAERIARERA